MSDIIENLDEEIKKIKLSLDSLITKREQFIIDEQLHKQHEEELKLKETVFDQKEKEQQHHEKIIDTIQELKQKKEYKIVEQPHNLSISVDQNSSILNQIKENTSSIKESTLATLEIVAQGNIQFNSNLVYTLFVGSIFAFFVYLLAVALITLFFNLYTNLLIPVPYNEIYADLSVAGIMLISGLILKPRKA